MNKKFKLAATVALLLMGTGAASAATMTLTFSAPASIGTTPNFGSVTGSFDFDTSVANGLGYSNWNVVVDYNNAAVPAGATDPFAYTTVTSVLDDGNLQGGGTTNATRLALYAALTAGNDFRELVLRFGTAPNTLTANGQTTTLTLGSQSKDTVYDGTSTTTGTDFNNGTLVVSNYNDGTPPPVAEPTTVALMGMGLAGLAAARRRKQA